MRTVMTMQFSPWRNAGTYYQAFDNGIADTGAANPVHVMCACGGTLHSLFMAASNTQTVGSWLIGPLINIVASNISVTIDSTHQFDRDMVHRARVNPGDLLTVYGTPTGAATMRVYRGSLFFDSDKPNEQPLMAGYEWNLNGAYNGLVNSGTDWSATESARCQVIPTTGVIRNLYIKLTVAPGVGKTRTFTVMKNGVATSLSAALADVTTGSDVDPSHAVSVVAGDTVSIYQTATASSTATGAHYWGTIWEPEINGEAISMSQTQADTLNPAAVEYTGCVGFNFNFGASTTAVLQGFRAVPPKLIFTKLRLLFSGNVGATGADGYTIGVWDPNALVEHIPVTVLGANTTGNSGTATGTNRVISASYETANMIIRITPVASPNAVGCNISHVRYLPPDSVNDYNLRPQLGGLGKNGGRIPMADARFPLRKTRIC